jgi:hypothetical protein
MKKLKSKTVTAFAGISLLSLLVFIPTVAGKGAMRVSEAVWANGELYDTILTPASFVAPPEHSTDTLYDFGMSGLMGQRAVADSAPGDKSYNGGRWSVKKVVFTEQGLEAHDPDDDGYVNFELDTAEDVLFHEGLGHLNIMDTTIYFECPLLPRK